MKLIAPIQITSDVLAASTLAESDAVDAPLWAAGVQAKGQRVRRPDHRIYQCVVPHTATAAVADYPENNLADTTAKWVFVRPTNLYAAFDSVMNTASIADSEVLSWTLTPAARVNTVALFGVRASSVRVRVTVNGVVKYEQIQNLRLRNCRTWTEWFTKTRSFRRDVSFTDLPMYRGAVIEIVVTWPGNLPEVGEAQIGRFDFLGDVQWKPSVRTVDYSKVETDIWGNTKFMPRRAVRVIEFDLFVKNETVDEVLRLLTLAKSSPRAWFGTPLFGALNLFGFVQDFQIVIDNPRGSFLNLQIQELT